MPDLETFPDLTEAIARLDAAEAAEQPVMQEAQVQTDGATEATPPEPTQESGVAETPDTLPADTQAAAEPKPAEPAKKPELTKPDPKSTFAKDQARRDTSWKAINTEKQKLEQDRKEFDAFKSSHAREVEQFTVKKAKESQRFTPEQYEQSASQRQGQSVQLTEQAEAWEARAEKLENAGDFKGAAQAKSNADSLKEQAAEARAIAKTLKVQADNVRKNPDPTLEQIKQRNDHAMKEYTLKAVAQWPEFGKENSEFQKAVVKHLQEARASGLDANEMPVLLYHAARLTAAEAGAARVPGMEKELGTLRARVKELEGLTAPGGGSGTAQRQPTGQGPRSDAEEESELRSIAATF